jgi:sortase A
MSPDPTLSFPTHIYIKWFVDTDIEPEVYVNDKWTISENTASFLTTSAKIGEKGNTILYGHNKRTIMGNIRALKGNEIIEITTKDGQKKEYRIVSRQEVSPTDTRLLQPTSDEVLTLYTCSGFMDSKRFVVQAVPIMTGEGQAASF